MCVIGDMYVKDRDASHGWYGFHYQAIAGLKLFLDEIIKYLVKEESPDDLSLRIEYVEDFIILEKNSPIRIFQAKKTLSYSIMVEVYNDFLLEQIYLNATNKIWYIVSDNSFDKMEYSNFEELYLNEFKLDYLRELELIINNIENREYLFENLKLKNSDSELKKIRQIIRNILSRKHNGKFKNISKEQFKEYIYDEVNILVERIKNLEDDNKLELLYKCIENKQLAINNINIDISRNIDILKKYIPTSEFKSTEDVKAYLVSFIYEKLTKRVKEDIQLEITFDDIKEGILARSANEYVWNRTMYLARVRLQEKLDEICSSCMHKLDLECNFEECIVNQVKIIDLENSLNNFNLELSTENIGNSTLQIITDKISTPKIKFFKGVLNDFKNSEMITLEINDNNDVIHFTKGDNKTVMVSWLDSDEYDKELELYKNDHINVYKEYDEILTKEYEKEIEFKNMGIYKENYEEGFDFPPGYKKSSLFDTKVKFVPKNKYKEI